MSYFTLNAVLYFLFPMVVSVVRLTKVASGGLNGLEISNLFDRLLAATSVLQYFTMSVQRVTDDFLT